MNMTAGFIAVSIGFVIVVIECLWRGHKLRRIELQCKQLASPQATQGYFYAGELHALKEIKKEIDRGYDEADRDKMAANQNNDIMEVAAAEIRKTVCERWSTVAAIMIEEIEQLNRNCPPPPNGFKGIWSWPSKENAMAELGTEEFSPNA